MSKRLSKYLSVGAIALASLFGQEINGPTPWEVIGNPFSQHNIHEQIGKKKLEYYGTGDFNNDEIIIINDF
jgi:hypothetical protein